MMIKGINRQSSIHFIILLGLVSLFADMTYEGARSITGPYLALLGANALLVGFVAGFGELVGYALRLASGYFADRTGKYWPITIFGYLCNLLAVPLLALTGHFVTAAALIIIERMGKAIRTPPRDAMLSYAGHQTGMGWGFGLHEALDQLGALLGPLLVAALLYYQGSYRLSFAMLLIPALFSLTLLMAALRFFPHPQKLLRVPDAITLTPTRKKEFWLYLTGAALVAAGLADFPLIAFHFAKMKILPQVWIPIAYAIAMGVDGFAALFSGLIYDKKGFIVLIVITCITSLFAPLVFLGSFHWALLGVVLWSIGVGAQETLMRAIVAHMMPTNKRASAYGVFNLCYGLAWFFGSVIMGALYDFSVLSLVIFSLAMHVLALPVLLLVRKTFKN